MSRRRTSFPLATAILISLLATAGSALAQPPSPAAPEPAAVQAPVQPWERPLGLEPMRVPAAQVVDLGQPGLSFRYAGSFGTSGTPYLADTQHLNRPNGIFVDGSGSLYVVEERGYRLLRYDASGANTLSAGQPGRPWHQDSYLAYPKDVAVDGTGTIWAVMDPALKRFDAAGNVLGTFPASNPWQPGSGNTRFDDPRGIAFDGAGRMFVSDSRNQRVQVYTLAGGTPAYSLTIGETGVSGSNNAHFRFPGQVAVDSSNRLYVADVDNYRVQRCTISAGWSCSTFHGTGTPGSGANKLDLASGLAIDAGDNIYIADGGNGRVKRCSTNGTCTVVIDGLGWPADVAVDGAGAIYVSDYDDHTVRKFDAGGNFLGVFAGTSGVPYLTDGSHYNTPAGIAVGGDGSLFVAEDEGYRLARSSASGQAQWTVGTAGVYGDDGAHFGNFYTGIQGNPGVDSAGRVYVPDTANHRIQVYGPGGSLQNSFGQFGTANNQFNCPAGVAISPVDGDIVVADRCNQRVQVFDSNWTYQQTLGQTGQAGADNQHFRNPAGVAVDGTGAIYVADSDNQRVQKCTLGTGGATCTTLAGETGVFGDDFGHLHPVSVAVDSQGRVYAVDLWNNRLQVFDGNGAYLTTVGGDTGSNTGSLRTPSGVAVDRAGNVYLADRDNHRVQKFSPGVPGWVQKNVNGFGDRWTIGATALEAFNGRLYAGASNWEDGGQVWRSSDGQSWTAASEPGFGSAHVDANPAIIDLAVFSGQLYASTGWGDGGGQLWRTSNGTNWTQVVNNGFGSSDNFAITSLAQFGNDLYAATHNTASGAQVWRSDSGNSGSWVQVAAAGFGGNPNTYVVANLHVFESQLYAATENEVQGAALWRTADGTNWTPVGGNGFGDLRNIHLGGLGTFAGQLYAGTRNDSTGGQVWRSGNGSSWLPVVFDGFGNPNNAKIEGLYPLGDRLYAVTNNPVNGLEVWRSPDGLSWSQVSLDGLGDSNNDATLWNNATAAYGDSLFLGTWNEANGGEVWRYLPNQVYLPAVRG